MSQGGGEQEVYKVQRRLCGVIELDLALRTATGLLIRRPKEAQMTIGGADIWPMTLEMKYSCGNESITVEAPYIPGSSLKGRMRFIAEHAEGLPLVTTDPNFRIFQHVRNLTAFQRVYGSKAKALEEFLKDIESRCVVDEVFGYASFQLGVLISTAESEKRQDLASRAKELFRDKVAPTRLYVDDFYVDPGYVCELRDKLGRHPYLYDFLEEKSENRIDRLTSAADPREIVRVKPGVPFRGRLRLLVFDIDAENCPGLNVSCAERNVRFIAEMLKAIEKLGLGAAVSRGYGRVNVEVEGVYVSRPSRFAEERVEDVKSLDDIVERAGEIARKALEGCGEGQKA